MKSEIIIASPAGNITVFVINPPVDDQSRILLVNSLMADSALKAEQLGFVIPPESPQALWTLEMMGGEFCGNAIRSFGLLAAQKSGFKGKASIMVKVSGVNRPLKVDVDMLSGDAQTEIPLPLAELSIDLDSRTFPFYVFEGISHVIIEDLSLDMYLAQELLKLADETVKSSGFSKLSACGFMFYDSKKNFLEPLVWLRTTGIFVLESSCGSGSAALAIHLARNFDNIDKTLEISQAGGTIRTHIKKCKGQIQLLTIGGTVTYDKYQ